MRPAVLAIVFLGAAACSTYDPNLGPMPFLCGTDEPRCPDGYTAVDMMGPPRCVCEEGILVPDAPEFYPCNGDIYEPNDGIQMATPTHIGLNDTDLFPSLAICPASDVDNFSLTVIQPTVILKATVTFDVGRHPPAIDFLDAGGVSLKPAVTSPQPGVLVATYTTSSAGIYYVRIAATQAVNYGLRIDIIPPS
jgi:hypothetical protein